MKTLTTEQQEELQNLLYKISGFESMDLSLRHELNYWAQELKPKRVRKKTNKLDTEEGVIEQAYCEHTGMIFTK